MILGFKEQFNKPIETGVKTHTIRNGHRWKKGMKIHFYNNVRTKKMKKFRDDGIVISVQDISITWNGEIPEISIDSLLMPITLHDLLAINDGFSNKEELYRWFKNDFKGQIIHWTNFRYYKANLHLWETSRSSISKTVDSKFQEYPMTPNECFKPKTKKS